MERAPQVGYSARILYQELCAQRGYAGGYGTVRDAVRPLRLEMGAASLTQCRFETGLGEQAQADSGEVRVRLGHQTPRDSPPFGLGIPSRVGQLGV